MKKLILLFTIIAITWSCQKIETKIDKKKSITEINSTKEDVADPTVGLELEVVFNSSSVQGIINNESRWPTLVLWRKKFNCKRLGICKFHMSTDNKRFVGREVNIPLIFNSSNSTFSKITIEFTSSPSFLSTEDIRFYIDEDFKIDVTPEMNLPYQKIRIPEGIIEYDSSIGQYGGYQITIIGIN